MFPQMFLVCADQGQEVYLRPFDQIIESGECWTPDLSKAHYFEARVIADCMAHWVIVHELQAVPSHDQANLFAGNVYVDEVDAFVVKGGGADGEM